MFFLLSILVNVTYHSLLRIKCLCDLPDWGTSSAERMRALAASLQHNSVLINLESVLFTQHRTNQAANRTFIFEESHPLKAIFDLYCC